jgi:organic hydroperoxide reductase OsmC/OhrA
VAVRARTFEYAVSLAGDGTARSGEGGTPLEPEEAWSPEHLVLAALARCTLTSLDYHARASGLELTRSAADASGTVTRRDSDDRYAFVRIMVELDARLEPAPQELRELLARAERDCFVGASLALKPDYRWIVNGEEVR